MESTLVTFTCVVCGRGPFRVVDRNPPIPMEVVAIYDDDNEGEDCTECPKCGTVFPEFALVKRERPIVWLYRDAASALLDALRYDMDNNAEDFDSAAIDAYDWLEKVAG